MFWDYHGEDDKSPLRLRDVLKWLTILLAVLALLLAYLLRSRPRHASRDVDRAVASLGEDAWVGDEAAEAEEREEVHVQIMEHRLRAPDRVRKMQQALKHAGFDPGPINGEFGPQTQQALAEFQKSFDLEPEGLEGTKTWAVLNHYVERSATQ